MNALATALDSSGKTTPRRAERIYVGLDVGYREHVAAACPLPVFNVVRNPDGWKRVHTLHFASDAAGFGRFQRYLDRLSNDPDNFLILLEPTGSYGLTVLLYLLGKGYRVLQVENRAVKDYREKIFGGDTKTDDTDARLMARMGFLHELVGEEFSIQPVLLVNPDAAALRAMVNDLTKLQRRSRGGAINSSRSRPPHSLSSRPSSRVRQLPRLLVRCLNASLLHTISQRLQLRKSPKYSAQHMPTATRLALLNCRPWRRHPLAPRCSHITSGDRRG